MAPAKRGEAWSAKKDEQTPGRQDLLKALNQPPHILARWGS